MTLRVPAMSPHERIFINLVLCLYFVITAGGMYQTATHNRSWAFPLLSEFSYGMLAPFQGDSDINAEVVLIAEEAGGATRILPVGRFFQGELGERTARSLLEQLKGRGELSALQEIYDPMLSQMLQHERERGHPYVSLSLYKEEWPKSAEGYEALRTRSIRTFIASVR